MSDDNKPEEFKNALTDFTAAVGFGNGAQLSKTDTMYYNLRYNLISNDRSVLSQMYAEHGLVQTLIDQPVDDSFSTGFEIKTGQLEPEEIEQLEIYLEREEAIKSVVSGAKWARLFGGGGVIIMTDQKPDTPLDPEAIRDTSNLEFKPFDMWELYNQNMNSPNNSADFLKMSEFFHYYGERIHKSRVMIIKGKEAPSFIRQRLRGWGMSEIERVIRSLNQYMKNQDVLFELMDEAKVDIYKMEGFNNALLTSGGTAKIAQRVQNANQVKNVLNALTMDIKDEYQQKQMQFAGLGEVFTQIRMQVASDLKFPMTKLFGISSSGFNSGEDDIENYNSMINSEVRAKIKFITIDVIGLCCQKLFGYIPDDLTIEWNPLRQMTSAEEEEMKNSQFNRTMSSLDSGAITRQEFAQSMNKGSLLPVEIDEKADQLPPLGGDYTVSTAGTKAT